MVYTFTKNLPLGPMYKGKKVVDIVQPGIFDIFRIQIAAC